MGSSRHRSGQGVPGRPGPLLSLRGEENGSLSHGSLSHGSLSQGSLSQGSLSQRTAPAVQAGTWHRLVLRSWRGPMRGGCTTPWAGCPQLAVCGSVCGSVCLLVGLSMGLSVCGSVCLPVPSHPAGLRLQAGCHGARPMAGTGGQC